MPADVENWVFGFGRRATAGLVRLQEIHRSNSGDLEVNGEVQVYREGEGGGVELGWHKEEKTRGYEYRVRSTER